MEVVKLGKKGQVTIPKALLRKIGLQESSPMLVSSTPDGGILLRPAGVYPIEIYTDERIREFEDASYVPDELLRKLEGRARPGRKKKSAK